MKIFLLTFLITASILPLSAQYTVMYGTTSVGGDSSAGTIFLFDPNSNSETVVYSFKGGEDGIEPSGQLTYNPQNGLFYGITFVGGSFNFGTIFSFNPATNEEQVIFAFNDTLGINPSDHLILENGSGLLYGVTYDGGINHLGTIFSLNPVNNNFTNLWNFGASGNGIYPSVALSYDPISSLFYGITTGGGNSANGGIFSFNPDSNMEQWVVNFESSNGYDPGGTLIYNSVNNKFYGTATNGGYGTGACFSFIPSNGIEELLYDFEGIHGESPGSSLAYYPVNGSYYGVTIHGGANSAGVIYTMDTLGNVRTVFNFGQSQQSGTNPQGSIFYNESDGLIYLLTRKGGAFGGGTLYSFNPVTDSANLIWNFGNNDDGMAPIGLVPYTFPSGINSFSASNISIYPNPTTRIISLSGLTSGQTIAVYDYLGEKVNSITASTSSQVLDLSTQESGIYLITISDRDGSVVSQKKVVKVN